MPAWKHHRLRLAGLFALLCALAVALAGFGGSPQAPLPTTTEEPTFVGPVSNLTATTADREHGAVRLTWTAAENAQVHFVAYLKSTDAAARNFGGTQMAAFSGTDGVISGLEGGTSYDFYAIGMRWNWIDYGAVWGSWAGPVSATPQETPQTAPTTALSSAEPSSVGPVTNVVATTVGQEHGAVRLTWTEAENAQVHFVAYLKSADAAASDFSGTQMAVFSGTEGVISGLESGISYDFYAIGMRWNWINYGAVWGSWAGPLSATPSQQSSSTQGATGPSATASDACTVGMTLREGDYCTVNLPRVDLGTSRFEIRNGSGCFGNICSANSVTISDFSASKNADGSWTVNSVPTTQSTPAANTPPTIQAIADQNATVGTNLTVTVSATDTDAGDTLTYTAVSSNTAVATVTASGNVVTATPVAAGTATITVTVSDGEANVSITFVVTVTTPVPVDAPAAPAWIKYQKVDVSLAPDYIRVWWAASPEAVWYETGKLGKVNAPTTETLDSRTCSLFLFGLFFCGGGPYKVRACNDAGCSNWTHTLPRPPANVKYQRDGSTIIVSWDRVAGADYYKVYHDSSDGGSCHLDASGNPSSCSKLAGSVAETRFTHANPDENTNYYWVTACNSAGCSDIQSNRPAVLDNTLLSPINVQYRRADSVAVVNWDPVPRADYYKIYYDDFFDSGCGLGSDGTPNFCELLVDNVSGTSYTHTSPDHDDNYYWVVACNNDGCSDIDSDSPAEYIDTRPSPPTNVRYRWNGSVIQVSWNGASGAERYRVYYDDFTSSGCRLGSGGDPIFCELLADNVSGTSYTHATPHESRNYYWVVACNSGGCSDIDSENPATEATTATTSESGTNNPPIIQAIANQNTVVGTNLTVTVSASDADAGDTLSYSAVSSNAAVATVATSGNVVTVTPVAAGTATITITVSDGKATVSDSFTVSVAAATGTQQTSPSSLQSPQNVQYIRNNDQVEVSWDAVPGAEHYKVYYDDFHSGLFFAELLADNISGTTYTHTSPDDDRNYYWVAACNRGGCSDFVSATFIDTRPAAPTNVELRYEQHGAVIVVSWSASASADYYRVYYDDFFNRASSADLLASDVTATNYTHAEPDDDRNYYWVAACNSGGCSTRAPAAFAETKPDQPDNVQYAREGSSIRISWDAVSGADYYRIYYEDFFSSFFFADELVSSVTGTSYLHTDPDEDTNYYWVAACNSGGCSDFVSATSDGS